MPVHERTHDISLTGKHLGNLDALTKVLNQSVSAGFPRTGGNRYLEVNVLLISWQDDDLGVATELSELDSVFRHVYGYHTDQWKIPSTQSHIALARRILDLLVTASSTDKLLIIYYGGHGFMNDQRDCVWLSNQGPDAASLQWSSIQTTLGQADSDVLILLDCCAAASSIGSSKGHSEVMGACGFESKASGVGDHSFTRSLIEELRYYGRRYPISTAFLYGKIVTRAKNSWNPRFERDADYERRKTPVHIHLSERSRQGCIELASFWPIVQSDMTSDFAMYPSQANSAIHSVTTSSPLSHDIDTSDQTDSSSSQTSIESQNLMPRVLITVALEQEQIMRTQDMIDWLKSIPALARWIRVESAYVSDSSLLILSLPIAIWDMLPKDPAISFVAFVRSRNLLTPEDLPVGQNILEANEENNLETSRAIVAPEDKIWNTVDRSTWWKRLKNDPHWSFVSDFTPSKLKLSKGSLRSTLYNLSESRQSLSTLVTSVTSRSSSSTLDVPSQNRKPALSTVASSDEHQVPIRPSAGDSGQSIEVSKQRPDTSLPHKRTFPMVIHLPEDSYEKRSACIDTAAAVDVISINAVESLNLKKEKYKGDPLAMAIIPYTPEWQITFDWHVDQFRKTYTSTMIVLDEEHSGDFDIMLGGHTIETLGFYLVNTDVWFTLDSIESIQKSGL